MTEKEEYRLKRAEYESEDPPEVYCRICQKTISFDDDFLEDGLCYDCRTWEQRLNERITGTAKIIGGIRYSIKTLENAGTPKETEVSRVELGKLLRKWESDYYEAIALLDEGPEGD